MKRLIKQVGLLFVLSCLGSKAYAASMTEQEFTAIIQKIEDLYQPIVAGHNQTLTIEADWNNDEPNAHSQQGQGGGSWKTILNGGLARRPEMTADGFALTVCHEIGHHLAGYPMYVGDWGMINSLSSEGQSDYYAAQACLRDLWKAEDNTVDMEALPESIAEKCDTAWASEAERKLCYRIVLAGKSAAETWAAIDKKIVNLETPDAAIVDNTNHNYYPTPQCRLDTYVAGALCEIPFNHAVIPGRLHPKGQQSQEAFNEAMRQSCTEGLGARPACWFYPAPP